MSNEDEHVDVDGYSDGEESEDDGDLFGQDSDEDSDVDVENDESGDEDGDQDSKENSMPKKKSHHNRLEQQRRVEMAKSFKRLEGLVRAEYPSVKLVKDKTMELAADLVRKFQSREGDLQEGLAELTDLNAVLRKKLEEIETAKGSSKADNSSSSSSTSQPTGRKHKR